MIKAIVILALVIVLLIVLLVFVVKAMCKARDEADTYKTENENLKMSAKRLEENIKNANEQKDSLNTGDDMSDFNNGINILQKSSRKSK